MRDLMQTDNEKYNETVQPNTAFLNELKDKLPEFFTEEGFFDLDKFRNQLKDKNVNQLSAYQLEVQSVVLFGYSFNITELHELENGLKQLDNKVTLIKRC